MLKPEFTGQFKKDYRIAVKRGCDPKELQETVRKTLILKLIRTGTHSNLF